MLKLFDTEKKENPDKIVQNLFPEGNSFPHWASGLTARSPRPGQEGAAPLTGRHLAPGAGGGGVLPVDEPLLPRPRDPVRHPDPV